jgi:predicted Zn finger-like uncharacterized protein
MIITVQCPSCVTSFPVDTDKVPPAGVSARCSICASIFRVEKPATNGNEPGPVNSDSSPAATEDALGGADTATGTAESADESWGGVGAVEPEDDRVEATWAFEAEEESSELDAEPLDMEPWTPEEPEETEPVAESAPSVEPEAQTIPEPESFVDSELPEEPEEDWRIEGFDIDLPELDSAEKEDVLAGPDLSAVESPPVEGETDAAEVDTESVQVEEAGIEGAEAEAVEIEHGGVGGVEAVEPREDADSEEGGEPSPVFQFGKRDPHEKAQRLARVLVSDMIMYNPERHDRALAGGTLRDDFDDEIKKSWDEYVAQIGEEIAHGTSYFTDALNDILAKGEDVFEGTPPD